MNSFLVWWQSFRVPDVVWGALIAGLVSYLTVRASNKHSLRLLKAQQVEATRIAEIKREQDVEDSIQERNHDRLQKEEDRKAGYRREVYASAIEEMLTVISYITGLVNRPPSATDDAVGHTRFQTSLSKIWLLGERRSSRLSRELMDVVGPLFMRAVPASQPLRMMRWEISELDKLQEKARERADELLKRMSEANLAGEDQKQKILQMAWKLQSDQSLDFGQKSLEKRKNLLPLLKDFHVSILSGIDPVHEAIFRLVAALRVELHLPDDEEMFLEMLKETKRKALQILAEVAGIDVTEL